MAIDQYSRVKHKRTQVSGATPTIGPSDDHTDGTWINDDIYPGEFFLDMGGQVGWFGWSGSSSTGVEPWFIGDISVGSLTSTDDDLEVTQVGANIIVSDVSTDPKFGGFNYKNLDFTIAAGTFTYLSPTALFTMVNPCIFTMEAKILLYDTTTDDTYFGVFVDSTISLLWVYDGSTISSIGSIPDTVGNVYEMLGGIPGRAYLYTQNPNTIRLRVDFSPITPNDIKARLFMKYRVLNTP